MVSLPSLTMMNVISFRTRSALPLRHALMGGLIASLASLGCSASDSGNDANGGSGGSSPGSGGTNMTSGGAGGSGGAAPGTGGVAPGVGGAGGTGGVATGGAAGTTGGTGGTTPGTGGATGGTGGAMPGTGGTGGGTPGGGCQQADVLCADFEADAEGGPPGAPWEMCGSLPTGYQLAVQAGTGYEGSKGFFSSGASTGTNYCAPYTDIGELPQFWVTARIKISGPVDMHHEVTFFELGPEPGDSNELRIGYRGDSSCPGPNGPHQGFELGALNGPGGEFTGCTGLKPSPDQWYCLEVSVDQTDGGEAALRSQLYVDGQLQSMLVHMQSHDTILSNSKVSYLKAGMQTYGEPFEGLVIDDLSVSTVRVGCD